MFFKRTVYLLVVMLIFTRFYGLNWGNGFFFQPDENNMGMAVSRLSWNNFNPRFFAYGQFPLYLSFFSLKAVNLFPTFANSVFVLRFWSALFSTVAVITLYRIFPNKIFFLLLIFSPGLIQMAHFGTTESLLFLVFCVNIYLSIKIVRKLSFRLLLLASLVSGIGIATKISAVLFLLPILIFHLLFLNSKNKYKSIYSMLVFLVITTFFALLFSPYNLISFTDFYSSIDYETGVATGKSVVFYTRQFINTTPYLFQFTHIFPYTSGLPVFVLAILGFFLLFTKHHVPRTKYLVIFLSCLIYFLYFGQLFAKWTRFMSPIFFIFPLLATVFLTKINFHFLKIILVILCILPGIYFFKVYLTDDVRLIASAWMNQNLPPSSIVLSESGNVVNLPVVNDNNLIVTNFDFYTLDTDPLLQSQLSRLVVNADYTLIPSRRIFANQNNNRYPHSQSYYQNLFSGRSGFRLIKIFSPGGNFILNDELAEETWTVFDRPTIRLFAKTNVSPD